MKMFVVIVLPTFALACSGESGFVEPQILPDESPVCMSYRDVSVGDTLIHAVLYTNKGKKPLEISGGEIIDDASGSFVFDDVRKSVDIGCTDAQPCPLEFDEGASARIFFTPMTEGWHTANIVIRSNAQNFPTFRNFVLARARPMGLGPNDPYDAGPKPDVANPGTASEACRDEDKPK